ncbi:putative zinc finger protein 702 [Actinia tenebrosa]|uniref:Zinc finger protein 702 n=1 Tax=Actinia tenebrosa TaxID=6105 RepID=A0A6P8ISI4_ACTTE|nr:putative zinc finger protein 702 [Actinia tenebrosa]
MECPNCNKTFSSKQRLQYHVSRGVCTKEKKSTICEDCDKELSTLQKLLYHVKKGVCHKEITTECNDCGKVLSTHQRLQTHKKIHERLYQRITKSYDLEGVDCYKCEDIMSRCEHKDKNIENRIRYRRKIHKTFPFFDVAEGVPWGNTEYWRQECDKCGCIREEEHIPNCLGIGMLNVNHSSETQC